MGASRARSLAGLVALVLMAVIGVLTPERARAQPGGISSPTVPGVQSASGPAVAVSNQADNVAIIVIRGEIDSYTARSVLRRIKAAEEAGADAIVFEMDTPGGELKAALEICNAIKATTVPLTVAWIHPDAYSAGAIISLACKRIVTGDPATMGDALPILMGMGTFQAFNELPEHERQKVMSPLVAEVVNSARRNGYDEMLVQAIVSRGVELWLVRDVRSGRLLCVTEAEHQLLFAGEPTRSGALLPSATAGTTGLPTDVGSAGQGMQPERPPPLVRSEDYFQPAGESLESLADAVNDELTERTSRPVLTAGDRGNYELVMYVTDGAGPIVMKAEDLRTLGVATATVKSEGDIRSYFGATHVAWMQESWSESMARFMVSWPVRFVLVVVFLIAIFVEMTHPGATVPGFIALVALAGLIAPSMIVGMASWWEVAAILGGVLMLALELFVVPGFGVFGFAGIVLLFGGLLGVIIPSGDRLFPGEAGTGQSALFSAAMLLAAIVTSGVAIYFITKHLGSLPIIDKLVLQDESGGGTLAAMAPGVHPLMGTAGVAITDLRPAGRAEIEGRLVDVVAEIGYIPAGTRVRVVSASAMRVGVEVDSDPAAT